MRALASMLEEHSFVAGPELQTVQAEWNALQKSFCSEISNGSVHPLSIVLALRSLVDSTDMLVATDLGSVHIWMARHFFAFEPRKLLFSNGQQTLGVGICGPWRRV